MRAGGAGNTFVTGFITGLGAVGTVDDDGRDGGETGLTVGVLLAFDLGGGGGGKFGGSCLGFILEYEAFDIESAFALMIASII